MSVGEEVATFSFDRPLTSSVSWSVGVEHYNCILIEVLFKSVQFVSLLYVNIVN